MKLGTVTTTGDPEGEIVSQNEDWRRVSREGLENAFSKVTGVIEQKPPKFSALKYQGKPYYEYARAGIEIPRPARQVEIHRITLRSFEPPYARFETSVSKGTYIRALAEDIGFALGCGASLTELRRTATGGFSIENAFTLEKLQALKESGEKDLNATLLPADALVAHLPRVEVNEGIAERLSHGQRISLFDIGLPLDTALPVCAVYRVSENAETKLLGIAEISNGALRPTRWL
jgi:tRNA pseudouridine55 synthase